MTSVFQIEYIKMFSKQTRVTLVTILLRDINDSDLQLLCIDILSENSVKMGVNYFLLE